MKKELVFMEGCFDNWDGTPEELAELVAHLHEMNESGEMELLAVPLDEEDAADLEKVLAGRQLRQ